MIKLHEANKKQKYWVLQTLERNYHSDGEPFRDEKWEDDYHSYNIPKQELLKMKQEAHQKLLAEVKPERLWGSKVEIGTRLAYVETIPNTAYFEHKIIKIVNEKISIIKAKRRNQELT